jgi:hypothetical protein
MAAPNRGKEAIVYIFLNSQVAAWGHHHKYDRFLASNKIYRIANRNKIRNLEIFGMRK